MTQTNFSRSGPLQQLAQAAGLSADWIDAHDRPQQVSDEALRAILRILGFACDDNTQCADSLRRINAEEAAQPLPQMVTAEVGKTVSLGARPQLVGLHYRLQLETGALLHGRFDDDARHDAQLPGIDEAGYHTLTTDVCEVTLAVAPRRCFGIRDALEGKTPRLPGTVALPWGVSVQLYGLRSHNDGGIGHFGGLADLVRQAAGQGAAAMAISPVHAMFGADPLRYSPYGPSSRLFLNALHVDPNAALGADGLQQVLHAGGPEMKALHAELEAQPLIDWARAAPHKLDVMRRLHALFATQATDLDQAAFAEFCRRGGDALEAHALYETISLHLRRQDASVPTDWRAWPKVYNAPHTPHSLAFAEQHPEEMSFQKFLQWQAARGLSVAQRDALSAGMAAGIVTDLAIGAENGGSQAWSHQTDIFQGLAIGAPPDLLNSRGQNWGIGALSPLEMRRNGYRGYLQMLRACFAHAGGVRIDHVLGLTRLWLVPSSSDASEGAYMRYPARDLLRLIALESWRHRAIVIGEDLGTVPAGFSDKLAEDGLYGIRVLWFQQDGAKRFMPPATWSSQAIAVTTTHDLPTVTGWWEGRDLEWRDQLDLLGKDVSLEQEQATRVEERANLWQAFTEAGVASGPIPATQDAQPVVDAAIAYVALTPASLAMMPIEDLLGLREQPNLPGTVETHPNWRRRLPDADGLLEREDSKRRLQSVQRIRQEQAEAAPAATVTAATPDD